jgi:hypothetical protein
VMTFPRRVEFSSNSFCSTKRQRYLKEIV